MVYHSCKKMKCSSLPSIFSLSLTLFLKDCFLKASHLQASFFMLGTKITLQTHIKILKKKIIASKIFLLEPLFFKFLSLFLISWKKWKYFKISIGSSFFFKTYHCNDKMNHLSRVHIRKT